MNWSQERFMKIQQILNSWKQRNLSLKGKIVILKTLVISRLVYTAQVLSCPKGWIKIYEKLFYTFLWGNRAKVKKKKFDKFNSERRYEHDRHLHSISFSTIEMVVYIFEL